MEIREREGQIIMTQQIESAFSEAINKIVEEKVAELIKEYSIVFSSSEPQTRDHNASSEPQKRVYTVEEIQEILGIGKNAAYDLIKTGKFNTIKVGGHYRISKKSFDAWLDKIEENDL